MCFPHSHTHVISMRVFRFSWLGFFFSQDFVEFLTHPKSRWVTHGQLLPSDRMGSPINCFIGQLKVGGNGNDDGNDNYLLFRSMKSRGSRPSRGFVVVGIVLRSRLRLYSNSYVFLSEGFFTAQPPLSEFRVTGQVTCGPSLGSWLVALMPSNYRGWMDGWLASRTRMRNAIKVHNKYYKLHLNTLLSGTIYHSVLRLTTAEKSANGTDR